MSGNESLCSVFIFPFCLKFQGDLAHELVPWPEALHQIPVSYGLRLGHPFAQFAPPLLYIGIELLVRIRLVRQFEGVFLSLSVRLFQFSPQTVPRTLLDLPLGQMVHTSPLSAVHNLLSKTKPARPLPRSRRVGQNNKRRQFLSGIGEQLNCHGETARHTAVSCKSPALRSGAVSLRVRILPSPGTICPEMADFRHTAILLFRCGLTRTVPVAGALRLVRSVRLLALAGRYGLANTRYFLTYQILLISLGLRCYSQGEIMRGCNPRMKGHGPS